MGAVADLIAVPVLSGGLLMGWKLGGVMAKVRRLERELEGVRDGVCEYVSTHDHRPDLSASTRVAIIRQIRGTQ